MSPVFCLFHYILRDEQFFTHRKFTCIQKRLLSVYSITAVVRSDLSNEKPPRRAAVSVGLSDCGDRDRAVGILCLDELLSRKAVAGLDSDLRALMVDQTGHHISMHRFHLLDTIVSGGVRRILSRLYDILKPQ